MSSLVFHAPPPRGKSQSHLDTADRRLSLNNTKLQCIKFLKLLPSPCPPIGFEIRSRLSEMLKNCARKPEKSRNDTELKSV